MPWAWIATLGELVLGTFQIEATFSAMGGRNISGNDSSLRILKQIKHWTVRRFLQPFLYLRCQRLMAPGPQTVLKLGDIAVDRCIQRARHVHTGPPIDDPEQNQG